MKIDPWERLEKLLEQKVRIPGTNLDMLVIDRRELVNIGFSEPEVGQAMASLAEAYRIHGYEIIGGIK